MIEKIIENFNFNIPKQLPPLSSLISGYFSYDIIRYIENGALSNALTTKWGMIILSK